MMTVKNNVYRTLIFIVISMIIIGYGIYKFNQQLSTRHAVVRSHIIHIAPQVSGLISSVFVIENQKVNKGDLLFTIDDANYQIALQSAQANLANVQQKIKQLKANISVAKANVQSAQDKYNFVLSEYNRTANLTGKGFVSTNNYDQIKSELLVAKSNIKVAQANLEQAIASRGKTGDDNAMIMSAQSLLNQATLNLKRTKISSPVDGNVLIVNINKGDYTHTGTPILAVVNQEYLWIQGAFPETVIDKIHVGDKAKVYLMSDTDKYYPGHVISIGSAINSKELPNPGLVAQLPRIFQWVRLAENIPVNVVLDNPSNNKNLISGQSATIEIIANNGN